MRHPIAIENIDALRRHNGIDDVELRAAIGRLQVGDLVKLTFLPDPANAGGGETLAVQITHIEGGAFRGQLTRRPASDELARLKAGSSIAFSAGNIHSILNRRIHHGR